MMVDARAAPSVAVVAAATLCLCFCVSGNCRPHLTDSTDVPRAPQALARRTPLVIQPSNLPLTVELRGEKLHWRVIYPGLDQQLHTADDLTSIDRIHLPCHSSVTIDFRSADYLYSFRSSAPGVEQIAVLDLTFHLQLAPLPVGELPYFGNPFCGGAHEYLSGQIIVESSQNLNAWLSGLSNQR